MSEENNKIIAEFMGGEYIEDTTPYKIHYYNFKVCPIQHISGKWTAPIEDLFYDVKWDWLWPIVDKIEELGFNTESEGWSNAHFFSVLKITPEKGLPCNEIEQIANGAAKTKIDAVYKYCVEFIKWYNDHLLPPQIVSKLG